MEVENWNQCWPGIGFLIIIESVFDQKKLKKDAVLLFIF